MEILAAYLPARHGETYVEADGRLWELQSWQTGTPASGPLTMQQKRHMLQAVAQFHHVVRGTPHDRSERGTSPGIAARNKLVEQWQRHSQASLIAQVDAFGMPHLRPFFRLFIDSFYACAAPLQKRLHALLSVPFPLEDCLGDPRPDNFLFTGSKLTGLIDLSSLRVDNRALDIARLGSELADDGAPDWEAVFQPVEEAAPLTADERRLVWTLDLANILLTGLNWLQWIVVEKRQFSSPRLVTARLHHLERRLAFLSEHPAWNA